MIKYLDYYEVQEFSTIAEACRLLGLNKSEFQRYAQQYGVEPVEGPSGKWGFPRWLLCNLHNHIYKEQREQTGNNPGFQNGSRGPWA